MSTAVLIVLAGCLLGLLAIVAGLTAANMARRRSGGDIGLPDWIRSGVYWRRTGITAVVIGMLFVLFFGAFNSSVGVPNLARTGGWQWSQAFWLIIVWVILASCLTAAFPRGAWRTGLQVALAALTVAILINSLWTAGVPSSEAKVSVQPRQTSGVGAAVLQAGVCQNLNSQEIRNCLLTEELSNWMLAEEGPAVDGMQPCYSPESMVWWEYKVVGGTSYWRFRARRGQVVMKYKLMRLSDGTTCPSI